MEILDWLLAQNTAETRIAYDEIVLLRQKVAEPHSSYVPCGFIDERGNLHKHQQALGWTIVYRFKDKS